MSATYISPGVRSVPLRHWNHQHPCLCRVGTAACLQYGVVAARRLYDYPHICLSCVAGEHINAFLNHSFGSGNLFTFRCCVHASESLAHSSLYCLPQAVRIQLQVWATRELASLHSDARLEAIHQKLLEYSSNQPPVRYGSSDCTISRSRVSRMILLQAPGTCECLDPSRAETEAEACSCSSG